MATKMGDYAYYFMGQLKRPLHLPKTIQEIHKKRKSLYMQSGQFILNKQDEEYLYNHVPHYILSKDELKEYGYPYKSPEDPSKWEVEQWTNERTCSQCFLPYSPVFQEDGNSLKGDCLYAYYFMGQLKRPLHLPKILQAKHKKRTSLYMQSGQFILNKQDEEYLYNHVLHYILSKDELKEYGYPYKSPEDPTKTVCNPSKWEVEQRTNERICSRCFLPYSPVVQEDGKSLPERSCQYHKYKCKAMLVLGTVKRLYPCCGKEEDAPGCQWSLYHVSSGYRLNSESFVSTRKKSDIKKVSGIYSLDCEMCYTLNGLEATRLSVVSYDGSIVYETYILPEAQIIDYNTNFSGITADDLKGVTITLPEVQDKLLELFDSDTILVGHGLENDLKALKIVHEKIIDTAILFPHECGWPYRRSLKSLASTYLCYPIQQSSNGHDSTEDARTCLKLLFVVMQSNC